MKIISKPKIPLQTCKKCGCVVKIKTGDLVLNWAGTEKDCFKCPICYGKNLVKFDETNAATEDAEK